MIPVNFDCAGKQEGPITYLNALITAQEGVQWRMDKVYGTAELKVLKLVLVEMVIGGFNASDLGAGTITNVFEKNLILFLKGKIENYKKRVYTA